jgi:hypothetical protein
MSIRLGIVEDRGIPMSQPILKALNGKPQVYNYKLCNNNATKMITTFREAQSLQDAGLVTITYVGGHNVFTRGPRWTKGLVIEETEQ